MSTPICRNDDACGMKVPNRVYNSCVVSCTSSLLLHSSRYRPRSRPRSHPRPVFIFAAVLISVSAPVHVPILCSSTGLHPRSRSHFAFLRSPPPPFSFPFRPRPIHRLRLCSRPRLRSHPRPRSLLLVPRTRLSPRYDACVWTPGPANESVGCSQAPTPVYRDDDACGMKVFAVKQKRIAAEDVLLPSPPPDAGTRWSVSRTLLYPSDGELLDKCMHV